MRCSGYEKINIALTTTIYVRLLDEGTDVWRPVDAEKISDSIFRLIGTHDDSERWEFSTGSRVRVETRELASGAEVVAV